MKIDSLIECYFSFVKSFSKQKIASSSHFKQSKVYRNYMISVLFYFIIVVLIFVVSFTLDETFKNTVPLIMLLPLLVITLYIKRLDRSLGVLIANHFMERDKAAYTTFIELLNTEHNIRCSNEIRTLITLIKEDTGRKYPTNFINLTPFSFLLALVVAAFNFSSFKDKGTWFVFILILLILLVSLHYIYKRLRDIINYSKRELRLELCKILEEMHLNLLIQENSREAPSTRSLKLLKKARRYRHF